jgi:hypothetical protein
MKRILGVMGLFVLLTLACIGTTSCADKAAEKAAIRANDISDCNNLMGLHVWYHGSFLNNVELEKCWVTTPEYTKTATWAQNANYWIGMDNIKAYYGPVTPYEQTKGGFQFHATTTGVVEIAQDRKTAKGVWYTPGAIGMGGSVQGMWERYGLDFINENGVWKIWHLHVYTDFSFSMKSGSGGGMGGPGGGAPQGSGGPPGSGAPQGAGGQGTPQMAQGGPPTGATQGAAPQGGAPAGAPQQTAGGQQGGDKAEKFGTESGGGTGRPQVAAQATAEVGYKELGADSYADLIPRPPEPYKTFSDTWSYGDPDEVKMFSGGYKEWPELKAKYKK